jgi:hypothetical protein
MKGSFNMAQAFDIFITINDGLGQVTARRVKLATYRAAHSSLCERWLARTV